MALAAAAVLFATGIYANYEFYKHKAITNGALHPETIRAKQKIDRGVTKLHREHLRKHVNEHVSYVTHQHKRMESHIKFVNKPNQKIRLRDPITKDMKTMLPRDWHLDIAKQRDWLRLISGKSELNLFEKEIDRLAIADAMDLQRDGIDGSQILTNRGTKRRPENSSDRGRPAIRQRVDDPVNQQSLDVDQMNLDPIGPRIPPEARNVRQNINVKAQHVVRHEHTPFKTSGRYAHEYLGRRHKFYSDITRASITVQQDGTSMYHVNPLVSGVGNHQRLRNSCFMDSLYLKLQLKALPGNKLSWVSIHLVLDMKPKGVTLTTAELRENSGPMDFTLVSDRFITIKRYDIALIGDQNQPTASSMAIIDEEVPIKKVVEFKTDGVGDISNISRGALYVHITCNFATVGCGFVSRLKFQDVTQ